MTSWYSFSNFTTTFCSLLKFFEIGPGRPSTQRLRWKGVTFYGTVTNGYGTVLAGENGDHVIWLDDCKVFNRGGRYSGSSQTFGNRYVPYITGGITTEMMNGPGAVLVRDHTILRVCSASQT